jgi:chromosome segregation ATPase
MARTRSEKSLDELREELRNLKARVSKKEQDVAALKKTEDQLREELRNVDEATRVRAEWRRVAKRLATILDNAWRDLPTLAEAKYVTDGEWILLEGLDARFTRLHDRLALLASRRSDTDE